MPCSSSSAAPTCPGSAYSRAACPDSKPSRSLLGLAARKGGRKGSNARRVRPPGAPSPPPHRSASDPAGAACRSGVHPKGGTPCAGQRPSPAAFPPQPARHPGVIALQVRPQPLAAPLAQVPLQQIALAEQAGALIDLVLDEAPAAQGQAAAQAGFDRPLRAASIQASSSRLESRQDRQHAADLGRRPQNWTAGRGYPGPWQLLAGCCA